MREIAKVIALTGLGLSAVGLAYSVKTRKAVHSYESADFGRIDVAGACKLSGDGVECWNADGKVDRELTKQVETYYVAHPDHTITIRYGRKNRLLVVRTMAKRNANVTLGGMPVWNGKPLNLEGEAGRSINGHGPALQWFSIDAGPAETTANISFSLHVFEGESTLPAKTGAATRVGPLKFQVGGITPGPTIQTYDGITSSGLETWNLAVTLDGLAAGPMPFLFPRPVTKQGKTIENVDRKGNPLPHNAKPPAAQAMTFFSGGAGTTHETITTVLNPEKIGGIAISAS